MAVDRLDHVVLTVSDIEQTVAFYGRVLGLERITYGAGRTALALPGQKINLAEPGDGARIQPVEICFTTAVPMAEIQAGLARLGLVVEEGPILRTGARHPILSVYVRDPDGHLVEISNEVPKT
ncbi:MAG: VOC family protein [Pseudomonadota bacterium]|nr:VOC family protein [Pseudomonadota bacterium]